MVQETSNHNQKVIIFDWGETLMKVLPQYSGPMADWPEVQEVEGAIVALEKLSGNHTMIVATNANESTVEKVWKALRRVGFGEYFAGVFTARELGSKKPAPEFFHSIESVLARSATEMIMVGDQYSTDITGAKAAGWQAIWYNPTNQIAPAALPFHDVEITHMSQLPYAIQKQKYPDYATCISWLAQSGATFALLSHVSLVASVAYLLAMRLKQKGKVVDPVLAHRGGLLHDLAKMDSVRKKKKGNAHSSDHAAMAKEMLLERRQPELADIADRHMLNPDPDTPRSPNTWEEKLVHFADKLAEGSRLVDPEERLELLESRYPEFAADLKSSLPALLRLQQEICASIHLTPEEMITSLHNDLSEG